MCVCMCVCLPNLIIQWPEIGAIAGTISGIARVLRWLQRSFNCQLSGSIAIFHRPAHKNLTETFVVHSTIDLPSNLTSSSFIESLKMYFWRALYIIVLACIFIFPLNTRFTKWARECYRYKFSKGQRAFTTTPRADIYIYKRFWTRNIETLLFIVRRFRCCNTVTIATQIRFVRFVWLSDIASLLFSVAFFFLFLYFER